MKLTLHKKLAQLLCFAALAGGLLATACGRTEQVETTEKQRIVTLGGSVTEITFALGAGGDVIGTDLSSTYPAEVQKLPRVGYWRTLSAEGVLSLQPSLVLADHECGPPSSLQQIESAGIPVQRLPESMSAEGLRTRIREIAAALGRKEQGEELITRVDQDYNDAQKLVQSLAGKPRTLFVYMRGSSIFSAGGTGTHADAMIKLCGGVNVATEISGMKPVSPEFFVHSQPDVLIVTKSGLESAGGIEPLRQRPGLAETPAIRNGHIVIVDDLAFLGFGPRMPEAIRQVAETYARVLQQSSTAAR